MMGSLSSGRVSCYSVDLVKQIETLLAYSWPGNIRELENRSRSSLSGQPREKRKLAAQALERTYCKQAAQEL